MRFICKGEHEPIPEAYHAFNDKEEFVDELVSEFSKPGRTVWYDTTKLKMKGECCNGKFKITCGQAKKI